MKFPGKRKTKHYFPVSEHGRVEFDLDFSRPSKVYIVGLDQLIVDIEARISEGFLAEYGLKKGESMVLDDHTIDQIYRVLKAEGKIVGEFAGGAIGNTLHNYSVLSETRSVALGAITKNITVNDYAFKYICTTNSLVDFSFLQPVDGPMGKAMCLLTPDSERTFAIGKGIMNEFDASYVQEDLIKGASQVLVSSYLFRDENSPMYSSALRACELAKKYNVPVVFTCGTSTLLSAKRDFFYHLVKEYVSVCAMNESEAFALVQENDPLIAADKMLDITDLVLLTVGPKGLYLCGHVDDQCKRETKDPLHTKSIAEYNKYEYSRAMLKADCTNPVKIYTHINPYMGGPGEIKNTNGAGDAALSALLHDISSNSYHRQILSNSPKHKFKFLTYSSIHQISKYANRVSFEILKQNSPRLLKGLPQKEDSLEDAYWDS